MAQALFFNKLFTGKYVNDGNIPGEIIDFIMADDGCLYAYNTPWGTLAKGKDREAKARSSKLTYLVLTKKGSDNFDIHFVVELDSVVDGQDPNVTYGGKNPNDLIRATDSATNFVTFKGKKIFSASAPISLQGLNPYGFRSSTSVQFDDEDADLFEKCTKLIKDAITNGSLKEIELCKPEANKPTWIDQFYNEQYKQLYNANPPEMKTRMNKASNQPSAPSNEDTPVPIPEPLKGHQEEHLSHNLIYFGAPGTGKSFKLKVAVEGEEKKDGTITKDKDHGIFVTLNKAGKVDKRLYERVTFYPTYSYAQFVGCYKPVMEETKREKNSESLSPEQLTEELKKSLALAGKNDNSDIDPGAGKIVSILLFGEKYYDSLGKLKPGDRNKILKDAGAKTKADPVYFGHGITMGRIHSERNEETANSTIAYKFVPGPFLRILVRALNNPHNNYCLVIEEINRANAAAVFGDVFQLLDRDSNGVSEYEVAVSEDVKKFLKENGIEKDCLRIPSNMYIWATMNSADQGVFPLDTAFKRRWEFEYIDIDNGEKNASDGQLLPNEWIIAGEKHKYRWNEVRKYINGLLSDNGVNEDKQMGVRFVTVTDAAKEGDPLSVISPETFKSKVLMYLWEDAARMCRQKTFANGIKTFSQLQNEWDNKGIDIFFKKEGQDAKSPMDLMPAKPDEEDKEKVVDSGNGD